MTQPRRPISRSSTPIEFAPLVLDLEPEVKEEPKKKDNKTKIIIIAVAIAAIIGSLSYIGLRKNSSEIYSKIIDKTQTLTPGITGAPEEKKRILTYGINKAKLVLDNNDGQDIIKLIIQEKSDDGITLVKEWSINGQLTGSGDTVKGFKRGDKVAVKILPFDGEKYGNAKILSIDIQNTLPRVIEDKVATFDGKQMTYQVKATDSDGDILTYSLVEAPQGMLINEKSGIMIWTNIPDNQREVNAKIKIVDGHGGEILYPITINIPKSAKEEMTAQK